MPKKITIIILAVLAALGVGYFISKQVSKDRTSSPNSSDTTSQHQSSGSTLDLSGQQLTSLPDSVLKRTDITTLNVSNNQLTSLPSGISNLTNLEVLNVENNRLEGKLADEIGQLKKLREIRSNNNRMTGIPTTIGQLSSLEIADFSNNRLVSLPLELGNLKHLKLLDLSGYNSSASDLKEIKVKLSNTRIKA